MHTALVTKWGEIPKYVEVDTPAVPSPESGLIQVKLLAAGLHRLVKARATGTHYSAKTLPHVPGADGVGLTHDGRAVYFSTMASGSFSELINVPKEDVTPLPEGVDPVQAAALFNAAMSSWMALNTRVFNLPKDFCVLIMGVTSASGVIAISVARALGASRVVGVARNVKALEGLALDGRIPLLDPVEQTDFSELGDVDVVLDYLYGKPTMHLFGQLKSKVPVQYVQIGSMAGMTGDLASALLRSKDITMRGSGPGAWSAEQLRNATPDILGVLRNVKKKEVREVKLADVESVWNEDGDKTVFVP